MNHDLVIAGKMLLPMDGKSDWIENPVIKVRGTKIVSVESNAKFQAEQSSNFLDARDCLLMPGLINTHTHSAMSLLRGFAEDLHFHDWLFKKVLPAETKAASKEFVYLGTLLSCIEMIKSGTTCFNDMYYFEEETARAAQQANMRLVASVTYLDNSAVDPYTDKEKKWDQFLEQLSSFPLVTPAVGPHAIYTVSTASFKEIVAYAEKNKLRVHIHLSETQKENDDCLNQHGKTPTQYLNDLGFWNLKATAAHAACLTLEDIQVLGKHRVGIAHNPESNLKLGTAIADITELKRAGAPVGLGTDSCASNNNLDLLQEVDFATKLQVFKKGTAQWSTKDSVEMMTINGAKALHLDSEIGSIEVGKKADLIAIDLNVANAIPLYNPYYHLCFSAVGADVKHSIINGEVVMRDKKLLTLDESAIFEEAIEYSRFLKTL